MSAYDKQKTAQPFEVYCIDVEDNRERKTNKYLVISKISSNFAPTSQILG